jgi:hypothetical protein
VQKWALWCAAGGPVRACVSSRDPARSMLSLCLFFGYHWHGGVVSVRALLSIPYAHIYKRTPPAAAAAELFRPHDARRAF